MKMLNKIILVICLFISMKGRGATSQSFDNKVFDARKLFDEDQKIISPRAGKTFNPDSSPQSEILFVTDIENGVENPEEKSDDSPMQNAESDNEAAILDPIFDIRDFVNEVKITTIDNKVILGVNGTDSKRNLQEKIKKDDISDALSNPQGPTKATLFRGGKAIDIQGGIDFQNAVYDEEMGKRCILKQEMIETVDKSPILECTHRPSSQCHYTYITKFKSSQEEICEENFEKSCQITFRQQAYNETVAKCYTPVSKECKGEGPEVCRTVYESSCSTKYVEMKPGKFVADTACEKLPVEICGAGCTYQDGVEECHDKVVASVVDVPEEVCDLNPQKTCRFATNLVPKLEPVQECTEVMKETCLLNFSKPKTIKKPLQTKWCLDESDFDIEEADRSSNKLVIPQIVFDNDITLFKEIEKSNQDPDLNENKTIIKSDEFNLDAEIVKEHRDDKANKNGMVLDLIFQSDNDVDDTNQTSDQFFPGRVDLAELQYLTSGNEIPIIEAGKTSDIIGPKRLERDLFSQRYYQTSFFLS